jgi:hypothetical protein
MDRWKVEVPPRCSYHQCVKGAAVAVEDERKRCILCKYYTRNLDSKKCFTCLESDNLDNFVVDQFVEESDWYKTMFRLTGKKGGQDETVKTM